MKTWKQFVAALAVGTALVAGPCISDATPVTPKPTSMVATNSPLRVHTIAPVKPLAHHTPVHTPAKTPAKAPAKKTVQVKSSIAPKKVSSTAKKSNVTAKKKPVSLKTHKVVATSTKKKTLAKKPPVTGHSLSSGQLHSTV